MAESEEKHLIGMVIKYFARGGFGFIHVDGNSEEYFFHISDFKPKISDIHLGVRVEFVSNMTNRGLQGIHCKIVD